ncbi:hypothetical protein HAX54_042480, partial [Datura stramonium]|nr:hypothetical protein [Datura stramonium]
EYMREIEIYSSIRADGMHNKGFIDWLRARIFILSLQGRTIDELISLAVGPEPLSEQVFYLNDMFDKDWLVVVKTNPYDLFSMTYVEEEALMNEEVYQQEEAEYNILHTNDQEIDIEEMKGTGQGKSGKGGRGRGHGNLIGRGSFGTTSQP